MSHNVCYDYNKCCWNLQPSQVVDFRGEHWLVISVLRDTVILSSRSTGEVLGVKCVDNVNERLRLSSDAFWDCFTGDILTRGSVVRLCDSLNIDNVVYRIFRVDQRRSRVGLRVERPNGVFVTTLWVDYDDIEAFSNKE